MFRCKVEECPVYKVNRCCGDCPEADTCNDCCSEVPENCDSREPIPEETAVAMFNTDQMTVMKEIATICKKKKALEEQEKALKDNLRAAMEAYGVKSIDNAVVKITYVAATSAFSIDSAKLKLKYPDVAAECTKESARSAYVKIEPKEKGAKNGK